ncbi:hypothetical protein LPC10_08555 [Methylorubrum sp. B1-46]|uniref:hypothetical protein n=1 Tax=Methylorubrum sp. B1-46 TaxID=2897334 RepID=UPI001E38E280|nr:hypothetical protein [Methylorubrum sp. B1-46]UGB27599.1 hypothetical protein LPC10_08555 [Methylorubrum sp. B1-46]
MAEATHERFVRTVMEHMCASLDLSYDEVMAERDRDERERLRRIWRETQDLAGRRAAALSPGAVTYSVGSTDKKLARELARRLDSGRPFTPRQCQVAAYLAWRYRRQISGRIVPGGPVAKP